MRTAVNLAAAFVITSVAFAEDAVPPLSLSKAAKLAEDAISSASLPSNYFLRGITLVEKPDAPAYYRATYKPPVRRVLVAGTQAPPVMLDVIHITMDGKVSFAQEDVNSRRGIRAARTK